MKACVAVIALILVTGLLSGCGCYLRGRAAYDTDRPARNTSQVKQEWGNSFHQVVANQVLNPDAGKNLDPVTGLSNTAADKTVNKYNKEFDKAPQVPVYTLGLSSGLGSSNSTGGR